MKSGRHDGLASLCADALVRAQRVGGAKSGRCGNAAKRGKVEAWAGGGRKNNSVGCVIRDEDDASGDLGLFRDQYRDDFGEWLVVCAIGCF
jgi:hypothetical protein